MKNKFRRFLAGLCTSMMLTQGIWDSGFVLYAAAGENAPVIEVASENDAEEVSDGENDASEKEEKASDKGAKDETASKDDAAAEKEEDAEDVDLPAGDTDGETLNNVVTIGEDGTVKIGSKTYGVYKNGTFTISKSVDRVVPYFYDWEGLKKIEFESGSKATVIHCDDVTHVGAFQGCPDLEEVDFSNANELTIIDTSAFNGCENLKKVNFNIKTQYIEDTAFAGCVSLNSIVIKKNIVSLGTRCFSGCENLESIRIEATNLTVDAGIFEGCNIKKFELESEVADNNEIIPENLFSGAGFAEGAVIEIPSTVKEIGANAFAGSNLQNIILPNDLTTISERAFSGCDELKAIDLKNVHRIEAEAFIGCSSLKALVIPDTVIWIGDHAFKGCSEVRELTLGQGTKDENCLGIGIFELCEGLHEVVIPSPWKYVGVDMFKDCDGLSTVTFSNTVTTIDVGAFEDCDFLFDITLPSNKAFTVIPDRCFKGCDCLIAVRISDDELGFREGITEIGANAFEECPYFSSVDFPTTLVSIGGFAFHKCLSIKAVTIPENVEYIGTSAFENCPVDEVTIKSKKISECGPRIFYLDLVRKINFPEGVNKIPDNLFNQTTWVTDRTIIIPNTVEYIGAGAFMGSPNDPRTSNFFEIKFEEKDGGGYNIKEIGDAAFCYSRAIKAFDIPDTVTYIGASAFEGCDKLESILIPESVTEIGRAAFADCSILSNITYNAIAVESSNENIFAACNVKNITIGSKVRLFPDNLFKGAQFAQVTGTEDPVWVTIKVPASTERIGSYALPNINNLQKVEFAAGSALTEIGDYAFQQCKNLVSCPIPATVKSIGTGAFLEDEKLTDIELPAGLEDLGASAFESCLGIKNVKIGAKLSEIMNDTFYNCKNLEKVEFAGGAVISAIGNGAFEGCEKIESITIPKSVESIGISAFSGCKVSTVNFDINGSLNVIEDEAFMGCPIGRLIEIPENTTVIGAGAFYNAGKNEKTQVYLPDTLTAIGDDAFNNTKPYIDNLEFYVVSGSYAEEWLIENGFSECIAGSTARKVKYTVTFDLQGHGEDREVMVVEGEMVQRPADPEEDGYDFGGWFEEKSCKTAYDFEKPVTKDITIYAKWDKRAQELKGGKSALDPTPEISVSTNELWLVKGQKFTIGDGWSVDKSVKKYVSISKKGVLTAKKETPAGIVVKLSHAGRTDITVHVCKPVIDKKLKLVVDSADQVKTGKISLTKDANIENVLWYSASPDVATVEQDGTVTAIGKGTAKVTAYVNGCAFTCTVTVKENVALSKRTMHLNVEASKKISVKGVKTAWTSEATEVAVITDKKGKKVKAVAPGEAVLTTTSNGTGYSITLYSEDITISGEKVEKTKANKYTVNLKAGESTDLVFSDSLEQDVVFKSSKADIAFVDENGHVFARSAGTSNLTTKINGKKVTVTVIVSE